MDHRAYLSIDLKSFYASVECVERGLDPLHTNLVVADVARTEKTICLAVSPSLKTYGIPGRARLFEVVQKVKEVNAERKARLKGDSFHGTSYFDMELQKDPSLELSYIAATPRMAYYMSYSTKIYQIYLRYVAPEDIHVYSIDEVFMDVTAYLRTYGLSARELAVKMIHEVMKETGITATAGIGTNLYLSKIAMDIEAKHCKPDKDGVRIAELDEESYRQNLWTHRPLTDFWRVGRGYAKKLAEYGMNTMGDIARCALGSEKDFYNEALLYKMFGINAELLIDHAFGYEPCTLAEIKAYRPETNSVSTGQVLQEPYDYNKGRVVVQEMTEMLVLDLVEKKVVTDQMVLTIGYDVENLLDESRAEKYHGEITTDGYGRKIPKHAHGSENLPMQTSSLRLIMEAVMNIYDRTVNPSLLMRRINVVANHLIPEEAAGAAGETYEQLSLFTDPGEEQKKRELLNQELERERRAQKAVLEIRKKYGKNAILKGMNLQEGATGKDRNKQIGGHKA